MYNNILVPLDGSKLAECVLPHVQAVANGCEVRNVTFLSVVEPFYLPSTGGEGYTFSDEDVTKFDKEHMQDAGDYLSRVRAEQSYKPAIKTEVVKGHAAEAITEFAAKHGVDLIIISTHGRSGISRWVWGSVADRVLQASWVPVFMVRAPGCGPGI